MLKYYWMAIKELICNRAILLSKNSLNTWSLIVYCLSRHIPLLYHVQLIYKYSLIPRPKGPGNEANTRTDGKYSYIPQGFSVLPANSSLPPSWGTGVSLTVLWVEDSEPGERGAGYLWENPT